MTDLGKQPLAEFLAAVAEATPAPGGGTSAGVTAALAAALVEMAARIGSVNEAGERAAALRAEALRLGEAELSSYAPVLKASSPEERDAALASASEPPCRIAELAAEVAELGASVAASASAAVRGDALTGVTLAAAAASAAARLVEINVGPDSELAQRAHAAAERASSAGS